MASSLRLCLAADHLSAGVCNQQFHCFLRITNCVWRPVSPFYRFFGMLEPWVTISAHSPTFPDAWIILGDQPGSLNLPAPSLIFRDTLEQPLETLPAPHSFSGILEQPYGDHSGSPLIFQDARITLATSAAHSLIFQDNWDALGDLRLFKA